MKLLLIALSLFQLLLSTHVLANTADKPITKLSTEFRQTYQKAIDHEQAKFMKYPVITQDLISMTLYTSTGKQERFKMNTHIYHAAAELSHVPLVIHNIASKYDWSFNSDMASELFSYQQLLSQVDIDISQAKYDIAFKQRSASIINNSKNYITKILTTKNVNKQGFFDYYNQLNSAIEKNLYAGAKTQIVQFNQQVHLWQKQYPHENWKNLQIAIMGPHGARSGYVLKQYFQWLMKEPGYEKKVVYVEYPDLGDIFKDRAKANQLAISKLISNNYQLNIGIDMKHDPAYMQNDVMSHAAKEVLSHMDRKL